MRVTLGLLKLRFGKEFGKVHKDHVGTHLDIREEHLEHVRAWVAGVEKHELGLLQMIGRETLLDLQTAAIKDINNRLEGKTSKRGS